MSCTRATLTLINDPFVKTKKKPPLSSFIFRVCCTKVCVIDGNDRLAFYDRFGKNSREAVDYVTTAEDTDNMCFSNNRRIV